MGFLDDLGSIVGDLRSISEEIEGYKTEALGMVQEYMTETTDAVSESSQDLKETLLGIDMPGEKPE